ncbi:MAG: peptidyl-prolyl cis-trans isomerase [Gemmatimonadota bacterium]|nr:peptidyl-prolyl cis-trans isomerase [Gemmatimonadota bacterium]
MMRTMRAIAPWIMLIVAVAFIGWMVFEVGMDVQGQTGGIPQSIARVNGRGIDATMFDARVRIAQENQRQQGVPSPTTLEDWRELQDAVLEQMVLELLLEEEYRRRGITVSDDEVREALLNFPPPEVQQAPDFQTEGQFDLEKYQRYIQSLAGEATIPLEQQYREQIRQAKFQTRITDDLHVSDAKLWRIFRDRNDSVTADLIALVPSVVIREETVSLSDDDLAQYYRRNREDFTQPPQAYLSFVALSRRANADDSVAALQRANAVRDEILGGADFAEVAQRESADTISAAEGGDLGEVESGQFVPAFEQAALALRPGEISQPILTQFGYHIIRLESKRGSTFHARHVLIPIELVGAHLDQVDRRADSLDLFAAEFDDPTVLDTVAADLGLSVAQAPPLLQGNRLQLGRFLVPDVHIWAFEATKGQTSQVIETDWAYYVFRADSVLPERVPPLDQIRDQVRREALLERQWEGTREVASRTRELVAAGADLQTVADSFAVRVQRVGPFTRLTPPPALGDAPDALGAAFGLNVGQVGGPFESEFAIYFVEPLRKVFADSDAFEAQKAELLSQVAQQARNARVQLVIAAMREQADVVDQREELERARRRAQSQQVPGSPLGF